MIHSPQNGGPVKFLRNWNHLLIANFFKLHKCQIFGLLKTLFNMSKIWYANNKFSFWKSLVYDERAVKNSIFYFFACFIFYISNDYCQSLKEKILFLWWNSKVLWSSSTSQNMFDLQMELNLQQWNDDPFEIFWNFHGNVFCFFIFSRWKKHYNLTFDDRFKMCCCTLC